MVGNTSNCEMIEVPKTLRRNNDRFIGSNYGFALHKHVSLVSMSNKRTSLKEVYSVEDLHRDDQKCQRKRSNLDLCESGL